MEQANSATSPSTINFNLGSAPATITLFQGQLELSNSAESVTIDGPGADLLSVSGDTVSQVFQVDKLATASISGLMITGGGLENSGTVTVTDCTISGDSGGGVNSSGMATLDGCTIRDNGGSAVHFGPRNTRRLHDQRQRRRTVAERNDERQ